MQKLLNARAKQAPSMADRYFIPAIAGLFVAVVVVIVLVAMVLRKHP